MKLGKQRGLPPGVEPQLDEVLDVDRVIAELEDYAGVDLDGDGLVGSATRSDLLKDEVKDDRAFLEDMLSDGDDIVAENYTGNIENDESLDDLGNPTEQSGEDYLKNFMIDDDDLDSNITLSDYNIQEDIILADDKKSFPFKKVLLIGFGLVACFLSVITIVFFNNYDIVPDKVKNATWCNENFSVMPKGYMVDIKDLKYGQTVMVIEDPSAMIKNYRYVTIIDTKMATPRSIRVFDNASGREGTVSLERISYILDVDLNENVQSNITPNDKKNMDAEIESENGDSDDSVTTDTSDIDDTNEEVEN